VHQQLPLVQLPIQLLKEEMLLQLQQQQFPRVQSQRLVLQSQPQLLALEMELQLHPPQLLVVEEQYLLLLQIIVLK
jgi:hypothetical protein